MSCDGWRRGPFGLDADMGSTVRAERTVLAVAHHSTAVTRLADVLPLVERDRRVQVVSTMAPASVLSVGVADHLHRLQGAVIPWQQATNMTWDLAIAAGDGGLEQIHAPVLSLQHGIGPNVLGHRWAGFGLPATPPVAGLRREALVAGGRVIPSAIALAHEDHKATLARVCPEAVPATAIVGDLCFDRLIASRRRRRAYRRALGVGPGQRLLVVSSTWGRRSLLGRHPDLLVRLATELPRETYRIAVNLHPVTWGWHGHRQITAWHDDCLQLGVLLLPPDEGWRAAVVAGDHVLGDHGSVTYFSASAGVPTVMAAFPDDDVLPGSQLELLGKIAPRLDLGRPVAAQLDHAADVFSADHYAALRSRLTSRPGESAAILRRVIYQLMRLAEPSSVPRIDPVPLPAPIRGDTEETIR